MMMTFWVQFYKKVEEKASKNAPDYKPEVLNVSVSTVIKDAETQKLAKSDQSLIFSIVDGADSKVRLAHLFSSLCEFFWC